MVNYKSSHLWVDTNIFNFLRKNKEISYEQFYKRLLDKVISNNSIVGKEYRKTKERVTHYLEGKKTIDYSGHTLLWDSQQEFHKNRNEVLNFTKSFYNEKFDTTNDTIIAQQHFVSEFGVKELKVTLNKNIYEYCYKNVTFIKSKQKTYKLKVKEPYDTEDDYMRIFELF